MAKNPTTKIQEECDSLLQEVGKLKYPKSLLSGSPTNVLHHYIPKSVSSALRYDWDNLIPLTNGEHWQIHNKSGNPDVANRILLKKGGQDWYDDLKLRGRAYHKVNMEMYRKVKERLLNEKADLLGQLNQIV